MVSLMSLVGPEKEFNLMRHRNARTKLSRKSGHRRALFRNLCIELIRRERIQTTETKAKALRSVVARVITLAKRQDLAARRRVLRFLPDRDVVAKLFDEVAPRFQTRAGGYTRVYKLGPRKGDGAQIAFIELLDRKAAAEEPEAPQKRPGFRERLFGSKPSEAKAGAAGS
jgi:large subunit ribosomal protein L17